MAFIRKILKALLLFLILRAIYIEFFTTKIEFINKTAYKIYMSKGEYDARNVEPTTAEIDNHQLITIDPNEKRYYSISIRSQFANYPVSISIGGNTRIYDSKGDSVSIMPNQGGSFVFSKYGFCDYEITMYEDYAEAKGVNKHFCYRRILMTSD